MKLFAVTLIALITFVTFGSAQAQVIVKKVPYRTHKRVVIKKHVHHHYYKHQPVRHHH